MDNNVIASIAACREERCVHTPELFSVRMPKPEVDDLQEALDRAALGRRGPSERAALASSDPHVVATLLLRQLRGLGQTTGMRARTLGKRPAWRMIPFACIDALRRSGGDDDACAVVARNAVASAPRPEHEVLRLIVKLCRDLLDASRSSGATRGKIARIFAPVLCPPSEGDEYLCVRHRTVLPCAARVLEALFAMPTFPRFDAELAAKSAREEEARRAVARLTTLAARRPIEIVASAAHRVAESGKRLTSSLPSPVALSLAEEIARITEERCTWPEAWTLGATHATSRSATKEHEAKESAATGERSGALLVRVAGFCAVAAFARAAAGAPSPVPSHSTAVVGADAGNSSSSTSDWEHYAGKLPKSPGRATHSPASKQRSPRRAAQAAVQGQGAARPASRRELELAAKEAQAQLTRLCAMSAAQLEEEKARIKRELKAWDTQWAAAHGGREPTKKAKESVRPWYTVYNELKFMLGVLKKLHRGEKGDVKSDAALALERRVLQRRISRFELKFEEENGRKVKFQRDVAGAHWQYARYKVGLC